MGVAGAGKTTVGRLLAAEVGWEFADADDFHSSGNVEKMRSGQALTDADRAPWLASLRLKIESWIGAKVNGVLACSALKRAYREQLLVGSEVRIAYLKGDEAVLRERLRSRQGHYMREEMLASQLAALEEPDDAITFDIAAGSNAAVEAIRARLGV
jgi:gluconokinase